ncbi:hypothetical protein [Alysiella crassa]|uniref:hypothetical protein n=1 Tax=Alysiella crassa TaxID=153491 RepID=UPI0012EBED01|nr:hypothetical protein [Alysiella crassa]UOP06457.1 hypothetical protein LVJ80_11935 [Alysiella crassa]
MAGSLWDKSGFRLPEHKSHIQAENVGCAMRTKFTEIFKLFNHIGEHSAPYDYFCRVL